MIENWEPPRIKLLSFDKVREQVAHLEDLRLEPNRTTHKERGVDPNVTDYAVVNFNRMNFTSAGTVYVPGFGILAMNSWAKRQLGTELGVKWDKFFGIQSPEDINKAISTHLKRRQEPIIKRIVARNFDKNEEKPKIAADGIVRGIVSPTYSEIRDERLFDRLSNVIPKGMLKDMNFGPYAFTDMGSQFVLISGEKVSLIATGKAGDRLGESAYHGVKIRNSEVGARSLTADEFLFRIICTNGMIVGAQTARLLYRKHRGISDDDLDNLIDAMVQEIPERREKIIQVTEKLHKIKISNPEEEIRDFMARCKQPLIVQNAAVEAFAQEPTYTAFGVLQGISRLAMALRTDPERQHEIEAIAGQFLEKYIQSA